MRLIRSFLFFAALFPILISCNKELKVNADWKDITVVYGLLDQHSDTTFIKITKAFLGPGNALQFAKIPDSSYYPDKLEVRLDEYDGTNLINSYPCDTVTIHNKEAGDSIFFYPDQLMYYSKAGLNQNYTYKLYIKNKKSGNEITSQTGLVHTFSIERPQVFASFPPGQSFEVKWDPAKNGKRYQLAIRFLYHEAKKTDPNKLILKHVDWIVFNNIQSTENQTLSFDYYYPGDAFYTVIGSKIPVDPTVTRSAYRAIFIFTVAATEMSTYMEVTEPSLSLVQEKPSYSNIVNGIGLFSSRFINSTDSLTLSSITLSELKVNTHTKDLGF
ncbi:MAG: hypothetical protein M0Q38_01110 [Bacteroidales bacterium]|jgi:hypothetical protein|nr:hypothetical protein [Bacteroidales bacterium]